MLGFRFMKASPTRWVLHYRNGRVVREGAGLCFFYHAPTSTIVTVPVDSGDLPFAFHEVTADFQTVTVQGQLTWSVEDPRAVGAMLDFTADPSGGVKGDGLEVLKQRLLTTAQLLTRTAIQRLPLRDALRSEDMVSGEVLRALQDSQAVTSLGVRILALAILAIRPTPETGRALEAEAREEMLRRADEAIYDRRNAAVLQERRIKESELQTDLAVEEQQRQIREAHMAADIAVEEQRVALISQRSANDRQEADARAYALETTLKPVRDMDWKTLMAVGVGSGDSALMIAVAFRELAENAQKIGELNVTPDLLRSLIKK